jgi:hypothetical protein
MVIHLALHSLSDPFSRTDLFLVVHASRMTGCSSTFRPAQMWGRLYRGMTSVKPLVAREAFVRLTQGEGGSQRSRAERTQRCGRTALTRPSLSGRCAYVEHGGSGATL